MKLLRRGRLSESRFWRWLVNSRLPYRSSRAHSQEPGHTDTDTGCHRPAHSIHPGRAAVCRELRRRRTAQRLPDDLNDTSGRESGQGLPNRR